MKCSKIELPEDILVYILQFIDIKLCRKDDYKGIILSKTIYEKFKQSVPKCKVTTNEFFCFCNTHRRVVSIHNTVQFCQPF